VRCQPSGNEETGALERLRAPTSPSKLSATRSFSPVSGSTCTFDQLAFRRRLGRRELELDRQQPAGDIGAQLADQLLEQREGFGLVLVERVALAVAAQANDVLEVVEVGQVLAPLLVDHAQQEVLLHLAHLRRGEQLLAIGGARVGGVLDALEDLVRADAFLGRPGGDRQVEAQHILHLEGQGMDVPLVGVGLRRHQPHDHLVDGVAAELVDDLRQVFRQHELGALLEHSFALVVHDVVVLEQVLADLVVALLDPSLGGGDGPVQPLVGDGLVFLHPEGAHDRIEALAGEDAQQVVLAGEEELGVAGVALAAGASA